MFKSPLAAYLLGLLQKSFLALGIADWAIVMSKPNRADITMT